MSDIIPEGGNPLEALTKKIGPLPGFVWVLIIVGLAYGVYFWKKRGAGTQAPLAVGDDPTAFGFSSAGPAAGTNGNPGVDNTLPVGHPAASTNAAWASLAGNALIATGKYDPGTVSNALSKYLSGQALSPAEQAIVNIAVRDYQLPPEGILPVKAAPVPLQNPTKAPAPKPAAKPLPKPLPKPVPKPAPKPAAKPAPKPVAKPAATYTLYTVRAGDSLSAIAGRFWGNSGAWMRLYNDNHAAIGANPNLIHPGLKLKVANHP